MGYVAVKGGADAIGYARQLVEFYRLREQTPPITIQQIRTQMRLSIDKIMGEGGLYAPEYAAIALKQSGGEEFEAAFILRAFITTLQRRYYSETIDTREMFVRRKISASFREIPGGQVLGPTRDYTQRLLDTSLAEETAETVQHFLSTLNGRIDPRRFTAIGTFDKVIDL